MSLDNIHPFTGRTLRLGIDVREACKHEKTGKGQWNYGFAAELLERDVPLTLFTDRTLPEIWLRHTEPRRGVQRKVFLLHQRGMSWHWAVTRLLRSDADVDCYVSPTSFIVPALLGRAVRHVPMVHDLIAFRREPHDLKAKAIERLMLRKAITGAAHICTVSRTTKTDLLARFPRLPPGSVTPIYAGPAFRDASERSPDGRTILCIGTLCPRKNQKRLIEAYAALPSHLRAQYRLILVGGRGWKDRDIIRAAQTTDGVEWKEYLPDDQCAALLQRATVLAFPSLYEGFGMPVLDAFARGVPVLTSDRGSLREVAGDAALIVDPEDVQSIRDGLHRLLEETSLRETLSARGRERASSFSWPRTVDLFLEAISTIKPS